MTKPKNKWEKFPDLRDIGEDDAVRIMTLAVPREPKDRLPEKMRQAFRALKKTARIVKR